MCARGSIRNPKQELLLILAISLPISHFIWPFLSANFSTVLPSSFGVFLPSNPISLCILVYRSAGWHLCSINWGILVRPEYLCAHVSRVILIQIFFFVCHGHTYKLFHFVHWFQNCFRFRSRTFPSHGGKFWQKCPFSIAKKWHFGCRYKKTETTFQCQYPPKMVKDTFVLGV